MDQTIHCRFTQMSMRPTEPLLWAVRWAVVINGALAAAVSLGLRADCWSGDLVGGHLAAVWATERDPAFVDVHGGIFATAHLRVRRPMMDSPNVVVAPRAL
jgi:type IV secretion system protein VirB3